MPFVTSSKNKDLSTNINPKKVSSIDCFYEIDALSAIGKVIAKEEVDPANFADF